MENNETSKANYYLIKGILPKRNNKRKEKNNILFIYLNLVVIYIIIYIIYQNINKKILYLNTNKYNKIISNNNYFSLNDAYESIVNKYTRSSIIWPLSKEVKYKPLMTDKELQAFLHFMKPENIYFEFGSGGSTNVASFFKVKTYSVESDVKWHKQLKDSGIKANYITIDLKSGPAGYPGTGTNVNDWKKYIQAYKKEYNADIILIDGRFRVACALDIFSKIRNDTVILIHDYESRKQYHILEKFYIKIRNWDSLALFLKNSSVNEIPQSLYNLYLNEKLI